MGWLDQSSIGDRVQVCFTTSLSEAAAFTRLLLAMQHCGFEVCVHGEMIEFIRGDHWTGFTILDASFAPTPIGLRVALAYRRLYSKKPAPPPTLNQLRNFIQDGTTQGALEGLQATEELVISSSMLVSPYPRGRSKEFVHAQAQGSLLHGEPRVFRHQANTIQRPEDASSRMRAQAHHLGFQEFSVTDTELIFYRGTDQPVNPDLEGYYAHPALLVIKWEPRRGGLVRSTLLSWTVSNWITDAWSPAKNDQKAIVASAFEDKTAGRMLDGRLKSRAVIRERNWAKPLVCVLLAIVAVSCVLAFLLDSAWIINIANALYLGFRRRDQHGGPIAFTAKDFEAGEGPIFGPAPQWVQEKLPEALARALPLNVENVSSSK